MTVDLTTMAIPELEELVADAEAELRRRRTLATAAEEVEQIARRVLTAEGVVEGEEWRQPTGAHDAYPEGWTVTHDGTTWVSLVAGNVWEPGVSGWREQTGDDGPAEWVQPTGGHDAYSTGDRVTFEGSVYESTIDGNTWSPAEYPSAWQDLGAVDDA